MARHKIARLSIRLSAPLRVAIEAAATQERRTPSDMLRQLAEDGLRQRGLLPKETSSLTKDGWPVPPGLTLGDPQRSKEVPDA